MASSGALCLVAPIVDRISSGDPLTDEVVMSGIARNAAMKIASSQWGENLLWTLCGILTFASVGGFEFLSWTFEKDVTAMLAGIFALAAIGVRATRAS